MKKIESNVMKSSFLNGKFHAYVFLFIFIVSIPVQLIFDLNFWFFTVFSGFGSILLYTMSKANFHNSYIKFNETSFEYKNYFENQGKLIGLKNISDTIKISYSGIRVRHEDISSIDYRTNIIYLTLKSGKKYELDIVYFGFKEIQEIKKEITKLRTKLLKKGDN